MGDDPIAHGLVELTIGEIHDAYRQGTLSAERLVERYLERIEAYDHHLNAILTVNEAAVTRARELDAHLETDGFAGSLHGIPVLLKDNQDTNDLPTTIGSKPLAGAVPSADAFIVEQLRDAGAVILAKANLQELSYGVDTISSLGGETRNPYALNRRPSGSSGGTAAAIAANLGTVGTGTDTCSSVRSPPAFTSLVGLRPTRGLVSRTGIAPLSETQDTAGPIARTVADAARMLNVLVGFDRADPVTAVGAGQRPPEGYLSHCEPTGLDGARIGVLREYFGLQDDASAPQAAAAQVVTVVETAIAEMESAGATIVDPAPTPDLTRVECARITNYEFKRDFDRYLSARDEVPSIDTLAQLLDTGEVAPRVADRIRDGDILDVDVSSLPSNLGYLRRLRRREEIRVETLAHLVELDLDAVLYPPSTIPPVARPEYQPFAELHCELAAHTGLPAIVVPAGFTPDGLPVGVELLGRPFSEPQLFELAAGFEATGGHRHPPDGFGPL